jgi:hypothetical protein
LGSVAVFEEGEVAVEVGVVSEGASCGTFFDGAKSFEEGFGAYGEGGLLLLVGAGAGLVSAGGGCVRRVCAGVEGGDDMLYSRRVEGGDGLGLAEGMKGSLVFVEVGQLLGFRSIVWGDGGSVRRGR